MNLVDCIILLLILTCAWTAYRRGFILSVLILTSWLLAFGLAMLLYKTGGNLLLKLHSKLGTYAPPLAFMLIIILTQVICDRLIVKLMRRLPSRVSNGKLNRWLGIIPGIVNGYIWATLLSAIFISYPLDTILSRSARESNLATHMAGKAGWLNERLSPIFSGALVQLHADNSPAESEEHMTKLPFTISNAKPRPDLEKQMLKLVNQERVQRGFQPLKADYELTQVARAHSADMLKRGYFSHYTPEGLDPFDRMKAAKLHFLTAGENIAITQTLDMAHKGLMHSPGHRANILNPAFGRVGIGILDAGVYGIMVTQSFRN